MSDEMVMRSVYLRPAEDAELRQLAHELSVSKSDLIRSAISVKLREWLESNSDELVLRDLKSGQRDSATDRSARVSTPVALTSNVKMPPAAKQPASRQRRQVDAPANPATQKGRKVAPAHKRQPEMAEI